MLVVGARGGASGGREASPASFERISNIVQHALLPLDEVRRIDRLPPLPPTSGTRCLNAWILVFLLAWWQIWDEVESHFGGL